jgi:hypothetical protein
VSTREGPAPAHGAGGVWTDERSDEGAERGGKRNEAYDPLRLCVYATIALLAWVLGPVAVVGFAALGFAGYRRARRAGLTRSRCVLRDTRLVLTYLAVLGLAGLGGIGWSVYGWLT